MGGGEHRRRDDGVTGEGRGVLKSNDRGSHRQVRKAIMQKEKLEYGDCLEGGGAMLGRGVGK